MKPKSGSTVPPEALELTESVSLALEEAATLPEDFFTPSEPGSVFDDQGRVPVVVIRPGIGKGRGRHLYEASMLQDNAHKFSGWKMYLDHESPEARKAAGGLPRSVRDLGGRLQETIWYDGIPADPEKGHGQGAVIGLAKPVPFIRELVENDPEIVESSISANATGVRPVTRDGQRVWLVEGIEDKGSLDWVTEAGAGGRVISLLEAAYDSDEAVEAALLESLSEDELRAEMDSRSAEEKTGSPRAAAETAKRKALSESHDPEGGDMADITPEALQEALTTQPTILLEALQQSAEVQLFVSGLVEAKLEEEREVTEQSAADRINRVIAVHRYKDIAHEMIEESRLPVSWQEGLKAEFSLTEAGEPTDSLDVLDTVDENGTTTESGEGKLRDAVKERIGSDRKRLAEANPTRVRAQGGATEVQEGAEPKPFDASKTGWGRFLNESGVDANKSFALKGAGDDQ